MELLRELPPELHRAGRGQGAQEAHHHAPPASDRLACRLGLGFIAAAALAAGLRASTAFEHGWWLVAYFALVGGLAQLLLVTGRASLAARAGPAPPARWRGWEVTLWNGGTVAVPIGVFSDGDPIVLGGSVLLLAALVLYAAGLHRPASPVPRGAPGWEAAYYALIVFLTGSVCVGAGLAGALPWQ